jgi:hypothetical protein
MANDTDLHQSEIERPEAGFEVHGVHGTRASPPRFGRLALCVAAAGALAIGVFGTVAYGVWFNQDQQAYAEAIASARQALGMPAAAQGTSVIAATAGTSAAAAPAGTPAGAQAVQAVQADQAAPVRDGEDGNKQAVWSGQVARAPAATVLSASLADATPAATPAATPITPATIMPTSITPATPTPSPRPTRRAASYNDSAAPPSSAGHPAKDARPAQADRHASQANAKRQGGLFARMSLFFRRVSYQQHGSGRQQPGQQPDLYSHP